MEIIYFSLLGIVFILIVSCHLFIDEKKNHKQYILHLKQQLKSIPRLKNNKYSKKAINELKDELEYEIYTYIAKYGRFK